MLLKHDRKGTEPPAWLLKLLMPVTDDQLRSSVETHSTKIASLVSAVKSLQEQRTQPPSRGRSRDGSKKREHTKHQGSGRTKILKKDFAPCTYPGCYRPHTHPVEDCGHRRNDEKHGFVRTAVTKQG
ncbi:unnamed protein product [Pylaiella littoralis]